MINHLNQFYINGQWVSPGDNGGVVQQLINPADESKIGELALATEDDADKAVSAAKNAFAAYSSTSVSKRLGFISAIAAGIVRRLPELCQAISLEMGAPAWLANKKQGPIGLAHFKMAERLLQEFSFASNLGSTQVIREPIGVCALITPWNWPLNQIACKLAPALAVGCTVVLKPSEQAPLSALILADIIDEVGLPDGVFNLVNGIGEVLGAALSRHPGVDMVSFTGSTRAGVAVAKNAAPTVKRVTQELGGKSANILLPDVNFERVVAAGVKQCFVNSGQSCNAPTRMLVPRDRLVEVERIAKQAVAELVVGHPDDSSTVIGPLVSKAQWIKVQGLIQQGLDKGASLLVGGLGRPAGLEKGYYVQPTIFTAVDNTMQIAQQEIFGPVLCVLPYDDLEHAVEIANDSPYGLSAYIWAGDIQRAKQLAAKLRVGMVHLNGAGMEADAPFGGYKQSGNGREWGAAGFDEFLETKAVLGFNV